MMIKPLLMGRSWFTKKSIAEESSWELLEEMDEGDCIALASRGNSEALSVLLHRYYSFLFKYLLKITMDPHLAEDLTQETMIRCIEKIHTYNGQAKFSTWLILIASNLYLDHLRKVKQEKKWRSQEQAVKKMEWQAATNNIKLLPVWEALIRLPCPVRIPIVLKHYYGYSYEEIAQMIQIATGTVKSRVHNGIKRLRKELSKNGRE